MCAKILDAGASAQRVKQVVLANARRELYRRKVVHGAWRAKPVHGEQSEPFDLNSLVSLMIVAV